MEAFNRGDVLHLEVGDTMDAEDVDESGCNTMDGLEELYDQATTPLYVGSTTSVVSTTIVIMNMCTVFRVSNRFSDELLCYLSSIVFSRVRNERNTHVDHFGFPSVWFNIRTLLQGV